MLRGVEVYRVNLEDGTTASFDLSDDSGRREWETVQGEPSKQEKIRGMSLSGEAHSVALTRPRKFDSVAWSANDVEGRQGEKTGEQTIIQADDIRLSITFYQSGLVRVDLTKTGTPRFLTQFKK